MKGHDLTAAGPVLQDRANRGVTHCDRVPTAAPNYPPTGRPTSRPRYPASEPRLSPAGLCRRETGHSSSRGVCGCGRPCSGPRSATDVHCGLGGRPQPRRTDSRPGLVRVVYGEQDRRLLPGGPLAPPLLPPLLPPDPVPDLLAPCPRVWGHRRSRRIASRCIGQCRGSLRQGRATNPRSLRLVRLGVVPQSSLRPRRRTVRRAGIGRTGRCRRTGRL
jgi:hypothetical protein